jgi:hypothetical protein
MTIWPVVSIWEKISQDLGLQQQIFPVTAASQKQVFPLSMIM